MRMGRRGMGGQDYVKKKRGGEGGEEKGKEDWGRGGKVNLTDGNSGKAVRETLCCAQMGVVMRYGVSLKLCSLHDGVVLGAERAWKLCVISV